MTLNSILTGILSVRFYILGSLALSLLLLVIGFRRKKELALWGWRAVLFNLSRERCLLLSVLLSQTVFVVAGALGNMRVSPFTGFFFAVLTLLACVLERRAAGILEQAVFTAMALLAMTAGNLLRDFMADTGCGWYMLTVYVLLLIFEIQYALYHLVKGLERMTAKHGR